MRIFTVSDIHLDYSANLIWLQSLSNFDFTDDILILAGDVTDNLSLLAKSFDLLLTKFRKLCFVPGNHELWVRGSEFDCSMQKFVAVQTLCREAQVATEPYTEGNITLVPLYSWYDYSFAKPDIYLKRAWRDYKSCVWPIDLGSSPAINRHFLNINLPVLQQKNELVISFSHFLPRIDVMPARIPLEKRNIYPVLGSKLLGEQVAMLSPNMHIYGHSHVNRAIRIDGINYVNNAFGYPSETHISRKDLKCVYQNGLLETAGFAEVEN